MFPHLVYIKEEGACRIAGVIVINENFKKNTSNWGKNKKVA